MSWLLIPVIAALMLACAQAESSASNPNVAAPASASASATATAVEAQPGHVVEPHLVKLGVAAGRRTGQTPIDALISTEVTAGRQFDILRAYAFWDSEFPDLRHQWASDGNRLLHLSINARRTDGSVTTWRTIADAPEDDPVYGELLLWIERLAAYDGPLRVTFHHEADIEPEFGSPNDFVAAWQRFAQLLDDAAPDVETAWVVTSFNIDEPTGAAFWPGDEYVDVIGADAFNWFGCRGNPEAWRSAQEVLAPLMAFGAQHPNKPLMLAELGTDEDADNPTRKALWLAELAELVTLNEYRNLEAVVFFHNDHDADGSTCDWWIDSTEATAAAFGDLAALPVFGGDLAASAPAQCPVIAMATSTVDDVALVDGDGDGRFDFEFGEENRFVGIGDQSGDGADHRVLLRFDRLDDLPPDATVELRIRVGERQPSLPSPIDLHLLGDFDRMSEAFGEPGQLLASAAFSSETVGGHHVIDVTGSIDPSQPSTLRLQFATPPLSGDGQSALYVGTGDATRSIDRPALIARNCG